MKPSVAHARAQYAPTSASMTSVLSVPGRISPRSTRAVRAALVECPSDGFFGCLLANASINTRIATRFCVRLTGQLPQLHAMCGSSRRRRRQSAWRVCSRQRHLSTDLGAAGAPTRTRRCVQMDVTQAQRYPQANSVVGGPVDSWCDGSRRGGQARRGGRPWRCWRRPGALCVRAGGRGRDAEAAW